MCHDQRHHAGFQRTYDRITATMYFKDLRKRLQEYIDHCPVCAENQTLRHKPFGFLNPIDVPEMPMAVQTADWIVKLPPTSEGFDALLTVTCKKSKRILLVPGRETWTAEEWADAYLTSLRKCSWMIPMALVCDRDPKWLSAFFRRLFGCLNARLLAATAHHPQTDGQSERTNQTVEIAMRYFVTANQDANWTDVLPDLQSFLNSSKNATTGVSPDQYLFGFDLNTDALIGLRQLPDEDFRALRLQYREQADEALDFANVRMKDRYDDKHERKTFDVGDYVYLRLYHGYKVHGEKSRKFGP